MGSESTNANESEEFGKEIGLLHEACITGRKCGWGKSDWSRLAHEPALLEQLKAVLDGRAEIRMRPEQDVPGSISARCGVRITFGLPLSKKRKKELLGGFERRASEQLPNPRATGTVEWKPEMLLLFVSKMQYGRRHNTGHDVSNAIHVSGKTLYSIADLEQLREKGLLPQVSEGTQIYAWADILRHGDGRLCVRCLHWFDGRWDWYSRWLDRAWFPDYPAAVSEAVSA